jgi:CRP-like cAMP-binding protein
MNPIQIEAGCLQHPGQNNLLMLLLSQLPVAQATLLANQLELVPLTLGQMLYEPGTHLEHAYFPTTAIISMHYVTESGATAETASVGNEGVLGISLFMGGVSTSSSAVVHTAGNAYRMARGDLMREFDRGQLMQNLLLRYTHVLVTQTLLTAACNRHHSLEQQLCRWLLTTLDRIPTRELTMTQELMSRMLGVRREGITEAAGKLQQAGCISYRRGHISVLDRSGLEQRACECYAVVKKEIHSLLLDTEIS